MVEEEKTYPSFFQACGLLLCWFFLITAWGFFLSLLFRTTIVDEHSTSAYILQWFFPHLVLSSGIIWFGLQRAGETGSGVWKSPPIPSFLYPFLLLFLIGQSLFLIEFSVLIQHLFPLPDLWMEVFRDLFRGHWFLVFLLVAVIVPIVEEFIFRGIILRGFLKRYTPFLAVVLSSVLFALMHMNIVQMVTGFLAGLVLGWLYYKTYSLKLVIVAHALHNTLSLISGGYTEFPALEVMSYKLMFSGLIVALATFFYLSRYWKKLFQKKEGEFIE